jgi:hypothetical protein
MSKIFGSNLTLHIANGEMAVQAVRHAMDSGIPLVDYGQAHGELGHAPPRLHTRIQHVDEGIAHDAGNFSVRVASGCALGKLQAQLASAGQFLPIDADDDLTIGEIITHNMCGALSVGFGQLHDLVLAMTFVTGTGSLIEIESEPHPREDVIRLMVGSMGELGLITHMTLRTYARPAGALAVDLAMESLELLDDLLMEWLKSDARPAWMTVRLEDHQFLTHLAYFGNPGQCAYQLRLLEMLLDEHPGIRIIGSADCPFDADQRARATYRAWRREVWAVVQLFVPPRYTGFACHAVAQRPFGDPQRIIEAYPPHGCIFVGGQLNSREARHLDEQIAHITQPTGGLRLWHRRPNGTETIEPVGPGQPDWSIRRRIKRIFDPQCLLNPGRIIPIADDRM